MRNPYYKNTRDIASLSVYFLPFQIPRTLAYANQNRFMNIAIRIGGT